MNLALYARVSSDRQDVDLSIGAQLRALREFAERNGHQVVREFVDEAESGRTARRPVFQQMISEAKQKPALRGGPRLEAVAFRAKPRGLHRLQITFAPTRRSGHFDQRTDGPEP